MLILKSFATCKRFLIPAQTSSGEGFGLLSKKSDSKFEENMY